MTDHVFGRDPKVDTQVWLAAALNKLGGLLRFWPEDLKSHRGFVTFTLSPTGIRIQFVPRRWARPWRIGGPKENRWEEGKAYLAMALTKLGGQMVITRDDLRFEAGDVGYVMQRKGEAFELRLLHQKGQLTTVGPYGAGARPILIAS